MAEKGKHHRKIIDRVKPFFFLDVLFLFLGERISGILAGLELTV